MLVLFYFIGFIHNVFARLPTENPDIYFNGLNYTEGKTYVVVKNKPLYIILENFNVHDVWCADYHYKTKDGIHQRFVEKISNSEIFVPAITNEMNAHWKCVLTTCRGDCSYWNRIQKDLNFYVHVKGAVSPKITVNGMNLDPKATDLSNKYDGTIEYMFEENEIVEVSCERSDVYYGVQVKYFDVNGYMLFQTDRIYFSSYAKFHSILKSEDNHYYIECSLDKSSSGDGEYVYRITFVQKKDLDKNIKQDGIAVSVDGIKLVPLPSAWKSASHNKYKYTFIWGDTIHLTCEKRTTLPASVTFSDSKDTSDFVEPSGKITVPLTIRKQNKTVFCIVKNNDDNTFYAEILLTYEVQERTVPVIRGLPEKNIKYRYTKNSTQHVIVYEYTNNEILNLTCATITNTYDLHWIFNNKIINPTQHLTILSGKYVNGTFALEDRHNGSTIKCIKKEHQRNCTLEVILHQKADVAPDINPERAPDGDDKRMIYLVYILGSLLFIAVLIIISICAIFWYKKNKFARHLRASYESLTRQTDSPIASFPSQWENHYEDHYTHIDANIYTNNTEDSRNSGIERNRRSVTNTLNDHLYTEIDDYDKPNNGINPTWRDAQSKIKNLDNNATKKPVGNIQANSSSENLIERCYDVTYDKLRRSGIENSNDGQNCSNTSYGNRHLKSNPQYSNNNVCNFRKNNIGLKSKSENTSNNVISNHDKTQVKQSRRNQVNPNLGNNVNSFVRNEQTDPDMYDYAEPYRELHINNECDAVACENDLYNVK